MVLCGDPDEGHSGRASGARVIDGIADVPKLPSGFHALDSEQALRRRFGLSDVLRAQQRIERAIRREPLERDLSLVLQAAGEDRQAEPLAQAFEQSRLGEPLFALDEPVYRFCR